LFYSNPSCTVVNNGDIEFYWQCSVPVTDLYGSPFNLVQDATVVASVQAVNLNGASNWNNPVNAQSLAFVFFAPYKLASPLKNW
jgi:hypothetical protein